MQKSLLLKLLAVGLIFLLLQIPLQMIGGLVHERGARQAGVADEIAASSFGRQQFAGPILSVPYIEDYDVVVEADHRQHIEHRREQRTLTFFPANADIAGNATVSSKHRSLFKVRVFDWNAHMNGEFIIKPTVDLPRTRTDSRITWGAATVTIGLSDPRGLTATPTLTWNGKTVAILRSSGLGAIPAGVHAVVGVIDPTLAHAITFGLDIGLQGTQSLSLVPVADSNHITLTSDWPSPSFSGQFLPRPSETGPAAGFAAEWSVTSLATSAQQSLLSAIEDRTPCSAGLCGDRLTVDFVDPVDVYSLTDRAQKYGFLFIAIGFGAFMLFELLRAAPIHPVQYGLVGLAIATFFLLLLALSEHFAFALSYLAAAAACVAQLAYYLANALGGRRYGLSFAVLLATLFGALYVLLVSEDNALILGATLVFALVTAALIMTRKFDWYALGGGKLK